MSTETAGHRHAGTPRLPAGEDVNAAWKHRHLPGHLVAALSAAAAVAVLGLSGCSKTEKSEESRLSSAASLPATAPPTAQRAPTVPVPPPAALTEVLYRLADPGIPGAQKLNLIEGATPDSAPVLDKFATALLDGGYAPMTFTARDIAWSDRRPADVVATVDVTTPNPNVRGFTFPMEFKPHQGGWQLSQQTADMLLAFSTSPAASAPAPTS